MYLPNRKVLFTCATWGWESKPRPQYQALYPPVDDCSKMGSAGWRRPKESSRPGISKCCKLDTNSPGKVLKSSTWAHHFLFLFNNCYVHRRVSDIIILVICAPALPYTGLCHAAHTSHTRHMSDS